MSVTKEKKDVIINDFKIHEKDTGSAPVQIAILTERVNKLTDHFKVHRKDRHSRRGMLELINRRRKLLDYLARKDKERYQKIIDKLNLRK